MKGRGTGPSPRRSTKRKPPKPERHRWLDHWMVAKGEPLRQVVQLAINAISHYEQHCGLRERARRPIDAAKHLASVDVAVSNLAYAVLVPPQPTGRLAVRLGSIRRGMTRYENPALGPKPFRRLIGQLERKHSFLSRKYSTVRGEVSSIVPTEWFAGKVREYGVTLADFGRDSNEELIVLTRNKRTFTSTGERMTERDQVDYAETEETRRYRDEMRRLNDYLASADIDFIEDGLEPRIDPFNRRLRRHFLVLEKQGERFDQGGRLFGGFWLTLKSARRQHIRIGGEPVADLDYSAMFTRLAYGRLGVRPPEGDDLYVVEGADGYRSGIKMAMNTFLFDTHMRRSKWPKEMGVGVGDDDAHRAGLKPASDYEARLPAGWTVGRTRKAILKRHPALAEAWGRALGYQLMLDESRILLLALNRLMVKGVPALGMHDGLLVQRSKKEIAMAIMARAANEIAGVDIPVKEKG